MRYTTLALTLTLVTVACSKKESPPETADATESDPVTTAKAESASPSTESPPESAQPAVGGPPVIKLITAGKPPLEKIRRQFRVGTREVLEVKEEHATEMKGGGMDEKHRPSGRIETIDVETKGVSANGTGEVALEVRKVVKTSPEMDASGVRSMDTTGVTGVYKVNSLGVISDFVMTPPQGSSLIRENLDMMRGQLRWMAPPFPEEAIGIGAKWTVDGIIFEHMTQMNEHMEVEMVERTESKIVLKFEVTATGSRRHDFTQQSQTIDLTINARGQTELDPTKLVPRSSTQDVKLVQAVTLLGVEPPPDGFLVMTIDWAVEAKRMRGK